MELGNMIFGHSRGEYKVDRYWEFAIHFLLEYANFSHYGEDFENDTFKMYPYCWCNKKDCNYCNANLPNFLHKKTGFKLWWYKYPLRDSYMNIDISLHKFLEIILDCINSGSK